jgi:hypothetical protein
MSSIQLPHGYEIREMTHEEFSPLWDKHAEKIFDDESQVFRLYEWLSDQEKTKAKELREFMGNPYQLRLGLFFEVALAAELLSSDFNVVNASPR